MYEVTDLNVPLYQEHCRPMQTEQDRIAAALPPAEMVVGKMFTFKDDFCGYTDHCTCWISNTDARNHLQAMQSDLKAFSVSWNPDLRF